MLINNVLVSSGVFNYLSKFRTTVIITTLVFATSFAGLIPRASAANFIVTKIADTDDGVCDADCSLREAIGAANALGGADTITLPAGVYILSIAGTGEDANTTGDLDVTESLDINGAGNATTIVDADGIDRVFDIHPGATVLIDAVTIRNGAPGANAGGIANRGTLTITNAVVADNTGLNFGGGIGNIGTLALIDTVVSNNDTNGPNLSAGGGGIFNQGDMTLTSSTISSNTTFGRGGGIYNLDMTSTVTNSTISGNTALNGGGIFNRFGTVSLTSSTVTDNTATDNGGGVWNFGGFMPLKNTIVGINMAATSADDCAGAITSLGYNIASDASCGLGGVGDLNSTDPLLGPLADNGGPTETHALLVGSPAIDWVPLGSCSVITDQRGAVRPGGLICDVGAYEDDGDGIFGVDDLCPLEPEDFDGDEDGDGCPDIALGSSACGAGSFDSMIIGTNASEILFGTLGDNFIDAKGGVNTVYGLDGDDCIVSGNGNDIIYGGSGNDEIHAEGGKNKVYGESGSDSIFTKSGSDIIETGSGNNIVDASNGSNKVTGGTGIDMITTGNGSDTIEVGIQDDTIDAGNGSNKIKGEGGDDMITTGAGSDNIDGGSGIDTCSAGSGTNTLISCEL